MTAAEKPVNTQTNIFDALAVLDPTVMFTMEPEPGWIWARCPVCIEVRYIRRSDASKVRCGMTPGCPGRMAVYLDVLCVTCGKPVTRRRRDADTRFCSRKCEEAR